LDAERVHQPHEIADYNVQRPRKIARHRRRLAKPAHVRSDNAKAACKIGHPPIPRRPALGIAVEQQDRLRLAPRVGKVVDEVAELPVRRALECRHYGSYLAAEFTPETRDGTKKARSFIPAGKLGSARRRRRRY